MQMKDDPELYRANSSRVHTDNVVFLERYKDNIKWKPSGDRTIDLGSGDGSMTKTLEKYLPPNYEALIGCDVSPKMVKFANEKYATDRISFHELDIEDDTPNQWRESFDHVFSFHMLQWTKKQQKAFENIYELLVPGGDCLLVIMGRHPLYDLLLALSTMDKWASYLKNVEKFLSSYYECQEPDEIARKMMKGIGFSQVNAHTKQMLVYYPSLEPLKSFIMAINPFHIPNELVDELLADADEVLRDLKLIHRDQDGREIVKCAYNLLFQYSKAKKTVRRYTIAEANFRKPRHNTKRTNNGRDGELIAGGHWAAQRAATCLKIAITRRRGAPKQMAAVQGH